MCTIIRLAVRKAPPLSWASFLSLGRGWGEQQRGEAEAEKAEGRQAEAVRKVLAAACPSGLPDKRRRPLPQPSTTAAPLVASLVLPLTKALWIPSWTPTITRTRMHQPPPLLDQPQWRRGEGRVAMYKPLEQPRLRGGLPPWLVWDRMHQPPTPQPAQPRRLGRALHRPPRLKGERAPPGICCTVMRRQQGRTSMMSRPPGRTTVIETTRVRAETEAGVAAMMLLSMRQPQQPSTVPSRRRFRCWAGAWQGLEWGWGLYGGGNSTLERERTLIS